MAIPDSQSLMLPVLKLASDVAEHRTSDVVDSLAEQLTLSDSEREELLQLKLTRAAAGANVGSSSPARSVDVSEKIIRRNRG